MERDDIIAGLRSAMSRGESLNHAIATFVNAGYDGELVEAAARMVGQQPQQIQPPSGAAPQLPQTPQRARPMSPGVQPPTQTPQGPTPTTLQIVSNYEQPKDKLGVVIVIVLVFVLIFLIGVLLAVVFFKPKMVEIINNIFGMVNALI